jgi:hypothetical protein
MHIGAAARTAVLPDVAARPETPAWRHRPESYPPGTGRRLRRRPGRRTRRRVSPGLPGGSLRVAAPPAGMARVLSATGMHQHLDIYPSLPAAIATWQRRTVAGSAGAGTHARPGTHSPSPCPASVPSTAANSGRQPPRSWLTTAPGATRIPAASSPRPCMSWPGSLPAAASVVSILATEPLTHFTGHRRCGKPSPPTPHRARHGNSAP